MLGTAAINADPAVPSTYNSDWVGWAHSCTGEQVRVARFGKGQYKVDFGDSSPAQLAIASASVPNGAPAGITVSNYDVGTFTVFLHDGSGHEVDADFSILAY